MMKKRKAVSMILSLATIFGGMTAMPAKAEGESGLIAKGYTFTDIAHHDNIYVAMAKNEDKSVAKMYYSDDNGLTWSQSADQPLASAINYANKDSQQQLTYWEDKDIFVAHGAKSTYTSEDGSAWIQNDAIHWTTNAMLTASEKQLILCGTGALNATNNIEEKKFAENKYALEKYAVQMMAVAAKPADGDGNISIFSTGSNVAHSLNLNISDDGTYNWSLQSSNSNEVIPMAAYDMVYAENADQFLFVNGSETLFAAKDAMNIVRNIVKEGVKVTGVAANDKHIVVGMSDGTMYYTDNAEISSESEWKEVLNVAGTSQCTEPIKNIEISDDGKFVMLSDTQIYKGSLAKGYANIKERVKIGVPEIANENAFKNVRLIGGAYSPTLDRYIVYGDTTVADENSKYYGKIFTSEDGLNWEEVYMGYTFSLRNLDDEGNIKSYGEVRNGAVWWEAQGQFIVSASTKDHTGVSLVSEDGLSWKSISPTGNKDAEGKPLPELDTDFRLNTDIAIAGDNLYTTNNGRQFRKYTAWNKDSMTFVGVTNVPESWYMNQIAVSDDEDPAVLMSQTASGAVRNNESDAAEELDKWTQINTIGGAGALTDAVFSKNLNKFVAVLSAGLRTSIVSKDGNVVQGPVVPGLVCNAIDTNGETFMFACRDGNVYTAADTADFSIDTVKLEKVPAAEFVKQENTMNVTNIFKAGDKFIATASDNTDSDVLVLDKNTDGVYEYASVSAILAPSELIPGTTVTLKIDASNTTGADSSFDIITAVYSDDEIVQFDRQTKTLSANSSENLLVDVALAEDLPENSVMKVFVWDSFDGMKPLTSSTNPFN